jgi:hypothetical protein
MATICVLFGIFGHLVGVAGNPPRTVRSNLYPTANRGLSQSRQSDRSPAKLSDPVSRGKA